MSDGADDGLDGLDGLLAGALPADVYRWHALAQPPGVRDRVEAAGWRWAHLAGWTATSKPVTMSAVGVALDLPAHYGRNLDALRDCLRDLLGPTLLVWDHWARLARADGPAFAAVLEILRDRARHPLPDAPGFAALLWGEGPPTGTRSLD